jgi:hypothetical protein
MSTIDEEGLVRAAAWAAWPRGVRQTRGPVRGWPDARVPPRASGPGAIPAHEARGAAQGTRVLSVPRAAPSIAAVWQATPGRVSRRCTASSHGPQIAWLGAAPRAMVASRRSRGHHRAVNPRAEAGSPACPMRAPTGPGCGAGGLSPTRPGPGAPGGRRPMLPASHGPRPPASPRRPRHPRLDPWAAVARQVAPFPRRHGREATRTPPATRPALRTPGRICASGLAPGPRLDGLGLAPQPLASALQEVEARLPRVPGALEGDIRAPTRPQLIGAREPSTGHRPPGATRWAPAHLPLRGPHPGPPPSWSGCPRRRTDRA